MYGILTTIYLSEATVCNPFQNYFVELELYIKCTVYYVFIDYMLVVEVIHAMSVGAKDTPSGYIASP